MFKSTMRFLAALVAVAALTFGLAACGGGEGDGNGDTATAGESANGGAGGGEETAGTVRIDGSSTVAPLGEAAAELFMQEHQDVQVTVGTSGTGGGFEKFCAGETDISEASRPIKEEEIALCDQAGIAYEQLTVANDALAVLVNPENPLECITTDQLAQIWGPGSDVSQWGQVTGLDQAPEGEIDLYGPGTDSGTFDYFTEAINGEEGAQRTDYNNIGEDDNSGIIGVTSSPGGMFYTGFSYYLENQDSVKALAIDSGNGCVEPSPETVQDGTYAPLGRGLYIYPSDAALAKPEVLSFVEYFIGNGEAIAEAAGFIGTTPEQAAEAGSQVEALTR